MQLKDGKKLPSFNPCLNKVNCYKERMTLKNEHVILRGI
jgi:hypothetical protein